MVVVRRGNLLDTKFSLVSPSPARSSVFVEKSATLIHWLQLCRNADFIIIGLIQYHHGCDFFGYYYGAVTFTAGEEERTTISNN